MNDTTAGIPPRVHRAGSVRVRVIGPFDRDVRLEGPAGEFADEIVLLISRSGSMSSTQGSRSRTLNPNDATCVVNSLPHSHRIPAGSVLHCFTMPRALLGMTAHGESSLASSNAADRTPLQHSAAAFLTTYVDSLLVGSATHPSDEATLVRFAAMLILEKPPRA